MLEGYIALNHLMLVVKTMDTKPSAVITSIGAVFFDPVTGVTGEQFYRCIRLDNNAVRGRSLGIETFMWWLNQPSVAQAELRNEQRYDLDVVIKEFILFLQKNADKQRLQVWSKGPSFSCGVMGHAIDSYNLGELWHFWNERDVCTVIELANVLGLNISESVKYDGARHHSLYSAIYQAKVVAYIWSHILKLSVISSV